MALDLYLLQKLNNLANQSIFWQKSFIFCADYLIYIIFGAVVLWGLVSFLLKYKESRKKILEMILLAAVSGITARFIIAEIIRFFYNRPRPFESLESVRQLVDHASGNSFPSGHATTAFAVAMAVAFYYPKTSICFFIAALLVGLGRVSAGVHWPSDILAGALVGILTTMILKKMKLHWQARNIH